MIAALLAISCANGSQDSVESESSSSCKSKIISGTYHTCGGLSLSGTVTTVAGDGTQGQVNGIGTNARIESPRGLTTDGDYLFWIDNSIPGDIRKMQISSNTVSDVFDASSSANPSRNIMYYDSALYVSGAHRIEKFTNILTASATKNIFAGSSASGYTDAIGASARFTGVGQVISNADASIFFVIETSNNLIRKIEVSSVNVTTFAGSQGSSSIVNGSVSNSRLDYAQFGVFLNNKMYFSDQDGNDTQFIRKVDLDTNTVSTLAGYDANNTSVDGTGTQAAFTEIASMTTDGKYLYIGDDNCVRKVDTDSAQVTTLVGDCSGQGYQDGSGTSVLFNTISGIVATNDALYVTDQNNKRIRKIQ
ncbi:MAG: hypothetical protein KDK41_05115 [Leptospiraceae bacterium]|nr:hypothetical protein [Leptospiraceae bacterium]